MNALTSMLSTGHRKQNCKRVHLRPNLVNFKWWQTHSWYRNSHRSYDCPRFGAAACVSCKQNIKTLHLYVTRYVTKHLELFLSVTSVNWNSNINKTKMFVVRMNVRPHWSGFTSSKKIIMECKTDKIWQVDAKQTKQENVSSDSI